MNTIVPMDIRSKLVHAYDKAVASTRVFVIPQIRKYFDNIVNLSLRLPFPNYFSLV